MVIIIILIIILMIIMLVIINIIIHLCGAIYIASLEPWFLVYCFPKEVVLEASVEEPK